MVVPQTEGVGVSRIVIRALTGCALALLATAGSAVSQSRTHALIVTGIGGEPQYQATFFEWGAAMTKAVTERWGVPAADVVFLTEQPDRDATLTDGRSTTEEIGKTIAAFDAQAGPDDVVFILLIGHGSYQNGESKLSLPGPDLSAADFATLLDRLGRRRIVFVNAASASGAFMQAAAGPNRVVITSTRSGNERNFAKFGGHFVAAFSEDVADTDKDGAVSMAEAFEYARIETQRAYESAQTLLTEHAVLDDNGDGEGSREINLESADGALARVTFLGTGAVVAGVEAPPDASPALRALYAEKRALEQSIADLRAVKDTMEPERYESELERLLIDLALKNQEIRRMEGGGAP
jgi:hypothetical protein